MGTGKQDVIRYLRTFDIVLFSMFLGFGVVGIVTFAVVGIPGIMFLIPAVLSFVYWLGKYRSTAVLVDLIEKDGELDKLLEDWKNGNKYFNGRLIAGKTFLMCKGYGLILRREEIVRIYPFIRKNGFAGDSHILRADTVDGKNHELTVLNIKGRDDEDVRRLMGGI